MDLKRFCKRGFTPDAFSLIIMMIALFACVSFMLTPAALAGSKSGVWPVQLVEDDTLMAGVDGGVSPYTIDLTAKNHYTGNALGQFTGVTTEAWPPAFETGISVYYANATFDPSESSTPSYDLMDWTLIEDTGGTLRSGNTNYAFDIPWDPAAPYGLLKFVQSGASPVQYGFRYATSGNP